MLRDQMTGRQAYRQEFRAPPQSTTPLVRPAPTKAIRICMVGLALMALVGLFTSLPRGHSPSSPMPPASSPTPAPTPAQVVVPRAQPVEGPLTSVGTPMLSGQQYYVAMPDGRHLLVNYKGWVDHACNLPRQPKGGANNAMYTDQATGVNWIWTVPAGTANVPQWIDP